jgi:pimeloyl-ACP methyl ester carboxylesterase
VSARRRFFATSCGPWLNWHVNNGSNYFVPIDNPIGFLPPPMFKGASEEEQQLYPTTSEENDGARSLRPESIHFTSFAPVAKASGERRANECGQPLILQPKAPPVLSVPPLIILGGTSQTLGQWRSHARGLAHGNRVTIVYECRGQGATNMSVSNVTMRVQVEDFVQFLQKLKITQPVDLCGFSFGGRIALAIAAHHPHLIRRLSLTGVGFDRDALGRMILNSWRAALATGNAHAMMLASLTNLHSPQFLTKFERHIPSLMSQAVKSQNYNGLLAILEQSHISDVDDPYHPVNLVPRICAPVQLIGGRDDRVVPLAEIERLGSCLRDQADVSVQFSSFDPGCHMLPVEHPSRWRALVDDFFAADTITTNSTHFNSADIRGGD